MGFTRVEAGLLTLAMIATACGPVAAETPVASPTKQPTEAPAIIPDKPLIIPTEPAGYPPTPEATQEGSIEFFNPLTTDDINNPNPDDAAIPSQLVARDNAIVSEMNAKKDQIAAICGVKAEYLTPVWKAHLAVDPVTQQSEYRWTRVLQANVPAGADIEAGIYTCWTRDEAGTLDTYPSVWDENGNLVVTEGNCFERIKGEVFWAGTTPVIYDASTSKFVIPGGINNDTLLQASSWRDLEKKVANPVANPFSPEVMAVLSESGNTWNAEGSLINAYGNKAISFVDGKWVDGSGAEISFETFQVIDTYGVDSQGRPLVVLTFDVSGEKRISLPSGESVTKIDLTASRAMVDENANTNPTDKKWGTYENITFERIQIVTQEDVDSGRLELSRAMMIRPWTDAIRPAVWSYVPLNSETWAWTLTEYSDDGYELNSYNGVPVPGGKPIVWSNDAMVVSDNVRYIDQSTQKWVINSAVQLYYDKEKGESLIFTFEYKDEMADPNDVNFVATQAALGNPSWTILRPLIMLDQALSPELRAKMEEFGGKPQVGSDVTGVVLAGSEMPQLQDIRFIPIISLQHLMQWYLLDPNDPIFDPKYPPLP